MFRGRPIIDVIQGGNVQCNCLTGTAHVVNGNCTCDNNGIGVEPIITNNCSPAPLRDGLWRCVNGNWVSDSNTPPTIINPIVTHSTNFIQKAIDLAKENPLITIGLGISIYVAFIKKAK